MLKKMIVAIAICLSSYVSAGTLGPSCVPGTVIVPCEQNRWKLGVEALYLKPTYSAIKAYDYSLTGVSRDLDPDADWGYRIGGAYQFSTGNALAMTWLHYDIETKHSNFAGLTPLAPGLIPSNLLTPYDLILENKFDQVNLVMGQYTGFSLVDNARFYGGLQYAKIRVDSANTYSLPLVVFAQIPPTMSRYDNSDFNGLGPIVGVYYSYDLPYGFSLAANTSGALLYGTSRYTTGFALLPSQAVIISSYASRKAIVPSLQAKLAISYVHAVAQGMLNIEGGYEAMNYFSALDTAGPSGLNPFVTTSDFGLYGPFVAVKWLADA